MVFLYNIGILLYGLIVRMVAPFNPKAKYFVNGRKRVWAEIKLKINPNDKHIWFHFASLGEFEQGRPVLEHIKTLHPEKKVVITFFSPSGYEIRKHYALADGVFYLPLDTHKNAIKFVEAINPELAIFTKYEFWHHYFKTLSDKNIPLFLISGIFRPNQIFFKFYGSFNRNMLKKISWLFVQNEESIRLLKQLGMENASIAGDTRFDRVVQNASNPTILPKIKAYCGTSKIFIAGSTWPADEQILKGLATENKDWKFIIAPHEIGAEHLNQIDRIFPAAMRYTQLTEKQSINTNVLIIDNIGMLSAIYQYGQIAYIGGGFGQGIHNTLEAAAYGLSIIFGPKYQKFQEAHDLIGIGAARSIDNEFDLIAAFQFFKENQKAAQAAKAYVNDQKGATENIYKKIKSYLT
jgi:3-deoxy-D-manno-octulosonic-acid transferase